MTDQYMDFPILNTELAKKIVCPRITAIFSPCTINCSHETHDNVGYVDILKSEYKIRDVTSYITYQRIVIISSLYSS